MTRASSGLLLSSCLDAGHLASVITRDIGFQLRVTGSNLTGACKLIFKVARNEVNDALFIECDVAGQEIELQSNLWDIKLSITEITSVIRINFQSCWSRVWEERPHWRSPRPASTAMEQSASWPIPVPHPPLERRAKRSPGRSHWLIDWLITALFS